MLKGKFSIQNLFKWGVIVLMIYSIWKCIKTDSENFKNNDIKENYSTDINLPEPTVETVKGDQPTCKTGTCGGSGGKGNCLSLTGEKLLPILDPRFNMREICKQSILLEDHLFQSNRRCTDCIKKHFLFCEGFAEEAITLDKNDEYNLSELRLPEKFRELQRRLWDKGEGPESIAQALRQIRKPLMAKYYKNF